MLRISHRTRYLCAVGVIVGGISASVQADVEWMTTDGVAELSLKVSASKQSASNSAPDAFEDAIEFEVGAGGPVAYFNLYLNEFVYGQIPLNGMLRIPGKDGSLTWDGLSVVISQNSLAEEMTAVIRDPHDQSVLFDLIDTHSQFDQVTDTISIHASEVRISKALANRLGNAELAGASAGSFHAAIDVIWSGGDDPARNANHEFLATMPSFSEPRGGAAADVVYTDCSGVSTYGPVGNIYAYALASTTCNIGNASLLWGTSNNGTPALAMNAYRIYDGRLEQIGQSWVKNSCCAAAGNSCGLTCTGGGGQQLGAGCSDVYGSGYNGGQSRLGPRAEINAFTGDITPAPGGSGDAIFKRLQVDVADMMATNYPGAQYLIEGVYVGSDDAANGNSANNASYRMAGISQSNFSMAMLGSMQVSVPAIYAWRDHGNGLNNPDNSVEIQQVDVPGEGIFHLASKVTDNGNGTWRYDYAVFNLNSDRSGGSFSIPIGAASVSDIGFKDVLYHSGEPFDNTDWTITNDGALLTWSSPETFGQNPNSNALRWGTMYNFWFTSDLGPDLEPGDATIGLFKPGSPTSISAQVTVPLAGAVIVRLPDGAPKIVATCGPTSFPVELRSGSETLAPASARLSYRYADGSFTEVGLSHIGGDIYEATLPEPDCNDAPEFYLSARSDLGTLVTNPKDAIDLQDYHIAEVGFADILTHLETDFESGLPAGWSQNGLWNVSATCSGIPTGACENAGSSNVAYFGRTSTCDFDTGLFMDDSMYLPQLAIPNTEFAQLTYCSALERDTTPIGDWPEVRVTPNGGGTVVVDQPAVGAFPGAAASWEQRTVDLTPFAGQTITIEFNFDNVFPSNDDKLGWQVDNVRITAAGVTCIPGCEGPDADANGDNVTDGRDLESIVAAVMSQSTDPQMLTALDFNDDGVVNTLDVAPIVDALLNQ